MRIGGGIVLGIVATVVGVSAAFWFALSGLIWSDGFAHGYGWEEGESELGVWLGVAGLFGWLVLLALAMVALFAAAKRRSRSSWVTAALVATDPRGLDPPHTVTPPPGASPQPPQVRRAEKPEYFLSTAAIRRIEGRGLVKPSAVRYSKY